MCTLAANFIYVNVSLLVITFQNEIHEECIQESPY